MQFLTQEILYRVEDDIQLIMVSQITMHENMQEDHDVSGLGLLGVLGTLELMK